MVNRTVAVAFQPRKILLLSGHPLVMPRNDSPRQWGCQLPPRATVVALPTAESRRSPCYTPRARLVRSSKPPRYGKPTGSEAGTFARVGNRENYDVAGLLPCRPMVALGWRGSGGMLAGQGSHQALSSLA